MTKWEREEKTGASVATSLVLHGVVLGVIVGAGALFHPKGESWGSSEAQPSAIQATMVNTIPLPPKVPPKEDNVLASETPSPAPIETKDKAEEAPSPKDIPIVVKKPTPPKVAEKPQQAVQKPQPTKPTDRAQTGETGGVRVAMSAVQNQAGVSSMNVSDAAFGSRFPYYIKQLNQKVAQQWYTSMLDKGAVGHRVYISFRVDRDGSVSQIQVAQPSGDATLDQTALRAVQHVDTFAPLPDGYSGSYLMVQYYFDPAH